MRIVYYLLTHRDPPQVRRLVSRLLEGEASHIVVHHDPKSAPLALAPSARVTLLDDPVDVRWGQISLVHAMWRIVEWLETADLPFEWVVFLSGQDYPVRPVAEIEAELRASNVDAYMEHEPIHSRPHPDDRFYQTLCRRRYFRRRISIPRFGSIFLRRRHPYVGGLRCYAGSQWMNLSRRAVESLWSQKPLASRLLRYLEGSLCPDETVFHTLLANDPDLSIANTHRRFILWQQHADNPEILSRDHLDAILKYDAWFAQKIDMGLSADLVDRLDEVISGGDPSAGDSPPL